MPPCALMNTELIRKPAEPSAPCRHLDRLLRSGFAEAAADTSAAGRSPGADRSPVADSRLRSPLAVLVADTVGHIRPVQVRTAEAVLDGIHPVVRKAGVRYSCLDREEDQRERCSRLNVDLLDIARHLAGVSCVSRQRSAINLASVGRTRSIEAGWLECRPAPIRAPSSERNERTHPERPLMVLVELRNPAGG